MRIFVWEYVSATTAADHSAAVASLRSEGRAMLQAIVADFARIPGVQLLTINPTDDEPAAFRCLAAEADFSLLIAPEFEERILSGRCRWVEEVGGRLLGSSSDIVEWVSDKWSLACRWNEAGVPTPETTLASADKLPPGVVLVKPRRGAGALGIESWHPRYAGREDYLVQTWVRGTPASVSFLIDSYGSATALAAGEQNLGGEQLVYRGGRLPLPPDQHERAVRLGLQAVQAVPGLRGYVGVDLVLGDDGDFAIEINPRLTTSYLGLRALGQDNLAAAMLRACRGEAIRPLRWNDGPIAFTTDGSVTWFTPRR
jgi:predicted ATP-grasp superfamily ATP-dependent carboligase